MFLLSHSRLDRDYNAALNILSEGNRIISSGTDDYRRGGDVRPPLGGVASETFKITN
jgi:transposase